jgi:peroxiredoxin
MIKNISKLLFAISALMVISCNTSPQYTLEGELEGLEANDKLYLVDVKPNRTQIALDSVTHMDGKFSFSGEIPPLRMYYINVNESNVNIPVFLQDGTISVRGDVKDPKTYKIGGTSQNDDYQVYIDNTMTFRNQIQAIANDLRSAQSQGKSAEVASLRQEYNDLVKEIKIYEKEYISEYKNSFLSFLLLNRMHQMSEVEVEEVEQLFNAFSQEIKQTEEASKLAELIEKSKAIAVGAKAEDFEAPTPDGGTLKLSENLGSKATLIDFWAAWCKPCRAANPHIKELYAKYKDQGLEVIGVSLDKSKEEWLKAIEEDGLPWLQVSHLQYFDGPIATSFDIRAIPSAFILDSDGKIVEKNIYGSQVDEALLKIFGN